MSKGQRGRPGRKKSIIHKAALELFIEKGINDTKINDIAKKAGVTHSLILYHYDTIDKIFIEIIKEMIAEYEEYTIDNVPKFSDDKVENIINLFLLPINWAKENIMKAKLLLYFNYISSLRSDLTDVTEKFNKTVDSNLKTAILKINNIKQCNYKDEEELEHIVKTIRGSINGLVTQQLMLNKSDFNETKTQIKFCINKLLFNT